MYLSYILIEFQRSHERIIKPFNTLNFADKYQKFDGYIYVKTGGLKEHIFSYVGLYKSNMSKTMKNDGKRALKEYLPNIVGVMRATNLAPVTIFETVNEYCQVFQGGVKDQFLQDNNYSAPDTWQEVM